MRLWPWRGGTEGEFVIHPVEEFPEGMISTFTIEYRVVDGRERERASGLITWGRFEDGWRSLQSFDLPAHWAISFKFPVREVCGG